MLLCVQGLSLKPKEEKHGLVRNLNPKPHCLQGCKEVYTECSSFGLTLISNVSTSNAPHMTQYVRVPPSFDPVVIGELVFQAVKSTL